MEVDAGRIVDMLNEDRAGELAVIIQYMKHHYEGAGPNSPGMTDALKRIAIDEMNHAEKLAERIDYLGGAPTKTPDVIKSGGDLAKMVRDDLDSEKFAIGRYKEHIRAVGGMGDSTTRRLLEGILSEEEDHASIFETFLGVEKGLAKPEAA